MAKRKTSPQLAVAIGTRRKMPQLSVTAPTTPDTRSLMELDASYSPLLGLPEDIRRMIWREVFGVAQSVHLYNQELPVRPIGHNGNYDFVRLENSPLRPGLNHFRCLATRSDHEYYNESKGYDDDLSLAIGLPRYDMPCRDVGCNHSDCYVSPRTTCINLSGFQTCRQMYLESTNVLYSSTSFCFSDKKTFLAFCSSLTPLQRIMLRKIHISSHEILDEKDWHSYPKERFPCLPGLRSLHMHIDLTSTANVVKSTTEASRKTSAATIGSIACCNSRFCP